jgi:sortase A
MPLKEIKFTDKDVRRIFRSETPLTKFWRLALRTTKQLIGLALVFTVFFFAINFSAYWARVQFALLNQPTTILPEPEPAPEPEPEPEPIIDYAPEIIITKLGVNAPLFVNVLPSQTLPTLEKGVVHYADTALPGQIGNTVIFGHSSDYPWSPGLYKNVFALLDQLVAGDKITIPYKSQRFTYEVTSAKVVRASDLSVLKKTADPQLTLITCYPVGTSQRRLVVSARLVEGTVTGEQTVEPLIQELPKVR